MTRGSCFLLFGFPLSGSWTYISHSLMPFWFCGKRIYSLNHVSQSLLCPFVDLRSFRHRICSIYGRFRSTEFSDRGQFPDHDLNFTEFFKWWSLLEIGVIICSIKEKIFENGSTEAYFLRDNHGIGWLFTHPWAPVYRKLSLGIHYGKLGYTITNTFFDHLGAEDSNARRVCHRDRTENWDPLLSSLYIG